jgi:hypothetical protein
MSTTIKWLCDQSDQRDQENTENLFQGVFRFLRIPEKHLDSHSSAIILCIHVHFLPIYI